MELKRIGLTEQFARMAADYPECFAGRVLSQYQGMYQVVTEKGELFAEVSGKFRYAAHTPADFPAVGDFVLLDREESHGGNGIIQHVLPRKSVLVRKAAGTAHEEQVVASNVDIIFICMSMNNDFNLRRLERYLSVGWDSGAIPAVVLTKSDLCEDIAGRLSEVESVALGVDVLVTSSLEEDRIAQLEPYLQPGRTVAFIGSSGVGKSTLINRLTGQSRQETQGLRKDDKGRHTTTRRELFLLSSGGMVIDTPGMREMGLESADLGRTFADIDQLALNCKYRDCSHTGEPGCAVAQAITDGSLSLERLQSYQKLSHEMSYAGLNARQIEAAKLERMFKDVGGMKNARKWAKEKNKRR